LALAGLLVSTHRQGEAVDVLEHLILSYPQSALVPQARRKLDEARGAVPKT
jgi:outer membrane protein assembly factor BamD (BamD/ComL family)